tara:strand:- start:12 stop:218 length:207 start_codon:yes stop_codon:yes gene_type:complete
MQQNSIKRGKTMAIDLTNKPLTRTEKAAIEQGKKLLKKARQDRRKKQQNKNLDEVTEWAYFESVFLGA